MVQVVQEVVTKIFACSSFFAYVNQKTSQVCTTEAASAPEFRPCFDWLCWPILLQRVQPFPFTMTSSTLTFRPELQFSLKH